METSRKKEATLAMVAPILKLSKLQIRATLGREMAEWYEQAPTTRLAPDHFGALLLADLLERLAFLQPEQRTEIVRQITTAACVPVQLVFADGAYCTWTGQTGWLELATGDVVAQLPAPPVETIGYNLVALERRAYAQIEKRQRNAQHSTGSVEEPGDVRDSSPDAVP